MKKGSDKPKIGWLRRKIRRHRHLVWGAPMLIVAFALGIFFLDVVSNNLGLAEQPANLGATFSMEYATFLGLDWKQVYLATIDDLRVRRLRLPAYWDVIEPKDGQWDFSAVDWQLQQANKYGVKVILAIGRKLPRWPECHVPAWAANLPEAQVRAKILTMLKKVVERYKNDPAIIAWQVENEPLLDFGQCPKPDRDFLKQEVATVRAIDHHPIMLTESGELSTWTRTAGIADILGISTYRTVWVKYIGLFYWPITPRTYSLKAKAISSFVDKVIISELQAEPWSPGPITLTPISQQLKQMNPEQLQDNLSFAKQIGFPDIYLWGIEWWYWLKQHGHPEMWQEGQRIFASLAPQPKTTGL